MLGHSCGYLLFRSEVKLPLPVEVAGSWADTAPAAGCFARGLPVLTRASLTVSGHSVGVSPVATRASDTPDAPHTPFPSPRSSINSCALGPAASSGVVGVKETRNLDLGMMITGRR